MTTKATSLAQVNREIQKRFPEIMLVKGRGYFYIASDDENMGLKLAELYTTSIMVNKLTQQTVEAWVKDVEYLVNKIEGKRDNYGFDGLPL